MSKLVNSLPQRLIAGERARHSRRGPDAGILGKSHDKKVTVERGTVSGPMMTLAPYSVRIIEI
jgi:hypothetical protein